MNLWDTIEPLSWGPVFVEPWRDDFYGTLYIVLMGFFVSLGCGLIGVYVVLRRMALVGDAISHSILPGVVLVFVLTGSWAVWTMMGGAILTGVLSVLLIELIHKTSRIKPDAAIGIVFTSLFALGVIMVSTMTGDVHFDAECVLYGEIGYVALDLPVDVAGWELVPASVMRMGAVCLLLVVLILLFYRQLLVTSFDPGLAASLGMRPALYHYALAGLLAVVIVSAIEAVGVILVIAMVIFPGATALLLARRLPQVMLWTVVFSALYAVLGYHLAQWLNSSIAGCMTVIALLVLALVWLLSPTQGVLASFLRRRLRAARSISQDVPKHTH